MVAAKSNLWFGLSVKIAATGDHQMILPCGVQIKGSRLAVVIGGESLQAVDSLGNDVRQQVSVIHQILSGMGQNCQAAGPVDEFNGVCQFHVVDRHIGRFPLGEEIPVETYIRHIAFGSARKIRAEYFIFGRIFLSQKNLRNQFACHDAVLGGGHDIRDGNGDAGGISEKSDFLFPGLLFLAQHILLNCIVFWVFIIKTVTKQMKIPITAGAVQLDGGQQFNTCSGGGIQSFRNCPDGIVVGNGGQCDSLGCALGDDVLGGIFPVAAVTGMDM